MSAWLELVNCTLARFSGPAIDFPQSLMQQTHFGPQASSDQDQRAIQIAQSYVLLDHFQDCHLEVFSERPQHWLQAVAQPNCRWLLDDWNNVSQEFRLQVSRARQEIQSKRKGRWANREIIELVLEQTDQAARRGRGVYFTPPDLARHVITQVDAMFRSELKGPYSIANCVGKILDPAVGAGVFFEQLILYLRTQYSDVEQWNGFVSQSLLPRLVGCDLMLPSLLATHLNIARSLLETGFDFRGPQRLNLVLANCLSDLDLAEDRDEAIEHGEQTLICSLLRAAPTSVVIGNPPFYSLSDNSGKWIQRLLRGPIDESVSRNYFEVDGQPLGEKKSWLHDDYVKFIRYAQWLIDRSEAAGIVGFVTNRGFLDNVTFRGMRYQLLQSFDRIAIADLHGDSRNRLASETNPDGPDENLFPIETGVAIAILGQANASAERKFIYQSIKGSAKSKIESLEAGNGKVEKRKTNLPGAPNYLFRDFDRQREAEYAKGIPLNEAMPDSWSAPVTARDHFVLAFSRAELCERIAQFRDLQIPDEKIREMFFQRTRSAKYPRGDTRGWQLPRARRKLADEEGWIDSLRSVAYRPFDQRTILWKSELIDWPRHELVRQMDLADNMALIARRQTPPDAENCFFFVTDQLMLDGIIRSDNRGNESIFPLRLLDKGASGGRVNFSDTWIKQVSSACNLNWVNNPECSSGEFNHVDLFGYIYALFYSTVYRRRFHELLCRDFPRVFVFSDPKVVRQLMVIGKRLVEVHLSRNVDSGSSYSLIQTSENAGIDKGFPKLSSGSVFINEQSHFKDVGEDIWNYRIGSHQVARKWLKDRRGRTLSLIEIANYQSALAAIKQTILLRREIDAQITEEIWQANC